MSISLPFLTENIFEVGPAPLPSLILGYLFYLGLYPPGAAEFTRFAWGIGGSADPGPIIYYPTLWRLLTLSRVDAAIYPITYC